MKILIKPRIHISLISMHEGGYRRNGGIGFSIEEPKGVINFSLSDDFFVTDKRKHPLASTEKEQLLNVLRKAQKALSLQKCVDIEIDGGMLTHYGMGSGTAIRLACIEALLLLNKKEATKDRLVELSGRGGTSGIGIHTYFSGQFVFDLGVRNTGTSFQPSSQINAPSKPLLLDVLDSPHWQIGICISGNISPKTQKEEIDFFNRACPIRDNESYKALYHCLFGTYAAIKENDMAVFSKSIKEIQACEWKRLERNEHNGKLTDMEKRLYELGAYCVGMSSLGPLLFFFAPDSKYQSIQDNMRCENCTIMITKTSNSGREIIP